MPEESESVIAGAPCFDSDSGRYHFLAFGGTGVTRLVGLDAVDGAIVSEVEVVLGPEEAFAEIEYCIPTGQIVGLWRDLSENGVMRLASVDPVTGIPTEIVALLRSGVSRRTVRSLTRTPTAMSCTTMTLRSTPICLRWTS